MTENERVKVLRKALDLTMEKFGERLGVTKVAISLIESGKNSVTDQMRRAICREFHVNEEWLKTGAGEMLARGYGEEIAALTRAYGLEPADEAMIMEFARLPLEHRRIVRDYIRDTFYAMSEADGAPAYAAPVIAAPAGIAAPPGPFPATIEEELEDYRRQLITEKKAEDGSGASPAQSA